MIHRVTAEVEVAESHSVGHGQHGQHAEIVLISACLIAGGVTWNGYNIYANV